MKSSWNWPCHLLILQLIVHTGTAAASNWKQQNSCQCPQEARDDKNHILKVQWSGMAGGVWGGWEGGGRGTGVES